MSHLDKIRAALRKMHLVKSLLREIVIADPNYHPAINGLAGGCHTITNKLKAVRNDIVRNQSCSSTSPPHTPIPYQKSEKQDSD